MRRVIAPALIRVLGPPLGQQIPRPVFITGAFSAHGTLFALVFTAGLIAHDAPLRRLPFTMNRNISSLLVLDEPRYSAPCQRAHRGVLTPSLHAMPPQSRLRCRFLLFLFSINP